MNSFKKALKSNAFNFLSVVFFTTIVLWFTLKDVYKEVFAILRSANIWWILVIVLISVFIQGVIGLGLKLLTNLSNPHYKLKQGIINAFVASFFHGVTPSASGGQFAQVYIFKKQGVDFSDSASILWMDFIIYQATMVLVVLCLLVIRFTYFKTHFTNLFPLVLTGFLINSAVIVGLWALGRFPKVYRFVSTKGIEIGYKIKIVKDKDKAHENLDVQLKRFDRETQRLQTHKLLIVKVVLVNVVRLCLYYSLPFFCAKALNIPVDISMLIDIMALSSYVSMVNAFIPIPGASGGTEAMFVIMFSALFNSVWASSIMIVWRIATYYLIMLLGGMVFVYAKQQKDVIFEGED